MVTDKRGDNFWVEGLQFEIVCAPNSNVVTSGPYLEATYDGMQAPSNVGFTHSIELFTETGVGSCLINGYQIVDLTIKVYDAFDQLLETLTG